jgi:hypothetical protein
MSKMDGLVDALEAAHMLDAVAQVCHNTARDHGFWEQNTEIRELISGAAISPKLRDELLSYVQQADVGLKVALFASEGSELLEASRHDQLNSPDEHCPEFTKGEIETADMIIRGFDFAKRHRMNIGGAIIAKMSYNAGRPYRHGKKS